MSDEAMALALVRGKTRAETAALIDPGAWC